LGNDTRWSGLARRDGQPSQRRPLYTEENTITPVLDERGEITHFIAVKQDITERKQAERALRDSEQRFSVFMAHLPFAAFIKDDEGRTLFANKYLQDLFGWREWDGKSTRELLPLEVGANGSRRSESACKVCWYPKRS
jgi:PAS domain-containing protein